jgi:hypothetical protein
VPKGIMVVQSRPDPKREDEYNAWYEGTHIPEILAIPGFVSARRYRLHDADGDPTRHNYLSIYELDADDITSPVRELQARAVAGQTTKNDVKMDPPANVVLWDAIE